jgi:lambda repressor-like predicted transcriptional regulator
MKQVRANEFKAFDYISAARSHFGMNRTEASQLTMTEFQMLLAAKYPDQKALLAKSTTASPMNIWLNRRFDARMRKSNRPSIQRYPENNKSSFSVAPVLFLGRMLFYQRGIGI